MDLDSLYILNNLPKEIREKQKGKIGVNIVENVVLSELGWLFAHNTLENDYGVDAYIERRELINENKIGISGQLIGLQIKSTDKSEVLEGKYRIFFSEAQKNYWANHTLPILLIQVDREKKECYWQEFKENLIKENNKARNDSKRKYYIDIPKSQKFNKDYKHHITVIAATGKYNKLITYLNHSKLMEKLVNDDFTLKAVFNDETTTFREDYLGRVVDLDLVPNKEGLLTESIDKMYIVPFKNEKFEYDEKLDPVIALKNFFEWADVTIVKNGEYNLELKKEFREIAKALTHIAKIV